MKADLHPTSYRLVIFEDLNNGHQFLTRSTAPAEQKTKWSDGQTYPLIKVHISSASHPFYTGQEKLIDVEGRVDKFKARQRAAATAQKQRQATSQQQSSRPDPDKSASKNPPAEPADPVVPAETEPKAEVKAGPKAEAKAKPATKS